MRLGEIEVSDMNVREMSEDEDVESLKQSIQRNDLISKLVLRLKDDKHELIAGQRRFLALKSLHGDNYELQDHEYVVRSDMDDKNAFLYSLEENQQRVALSPMDLNRALLNLNHWGYKDGDVARLLNVTKARLKRLEHLGQDIRRMPEEVRNELAKPVGEGKITDAHWDKIRSLDDPDMIKDVVDQIMDKELPARDVPRIVDAVKKAFDAEPALGDGSSAPANPGSPDDPGHPMEYAHKGQLILEEHGDEKILKVIGKGEDDEIPIDHYLEYLRYPEKFKCTINFKMKVKPLD